MDIGSDIMPSAVIHRCVSKIVNIKLNSKFVSSDNFYYELGSIAPDCWRHSENLLDCNLTKKEKRQKSHFMTEKDKEDYETFYKEYKDKMDNTFIFGYLVHLITDNYWRNFTVKEYEESKKKEIYERLINEFVVYDIRKLTDEQINKIPQIKELDFSGLNRTLEYLYKNPISSKEIDIDYTVVLKKLHKCSDFVLKEIAKLQKDNN